MPKLHFGTFHFNSMLKVGDTHTTQPSHQERIWKTQKIEHEVIFISNHAPINNKLGVWRPKALVNNLFSIKPFLSCRLSCVRFLHVNVISYLHLQKSIKKTGWKCDELWILLLSATAKKYASSIVVLFMIVSHNVTQWELAAIVPYFQSLVVFVLTFKWEHEN